MSPSGSLKKVLSRLRSVASFITFRMLKVTSSMHVRAFRTTYFSFAVSRLLAKASRFRYEVKTEVEFSS